MTVETAIPIGKPGQLQYLVYGYQTVSVTGSTGAGTVTVASVSYVDAVVRIDTRDSSTTVEQYTTSSGSISANAIACKFYTNTLSGPTLALRATGSYTTYYVVIGH